MKKIRGQLVGIDLLHDAAPAQKIASCGGCTTDQVIAKPLITGTDRLVVLTGQQLQVTVRLTGASKGTAIEKPKPLNLVIHSTDG